MMNFPNGFSDPCGMQMNNYGMGMGNYRMGMMGAQYPQYTPQIIGRPAPLEAYTSRTKDDTAVKVAGLGALAIVVGALLLRGKGLKGLLKSSKNVDKATKAAAETNTATATAAKSAVAYAETTVSASGATKSAAASAEGLAGKTSKKVPVNSAAMKKIEANVKRDMAKNPQVSSANNPIILPEKLPRPVSKAVLDKVEANVKRDMAKNPQVSSAKNPIILPERMPRPVSAAPANIATAEKVEATVVKDITKYSQVPATQTQNSLSETVANKVKSNAVNSSVAQKIEEKTVAGMATNSQVVSTQNQQAISAQTSQNSVAKTLDATFESTSNATQITSASKPTVTTAGTKIANNADVTEFAGRETKSAAVIMQGNKGNLTNAQRRNAELNYATEVKNGKHIEPAITETERIKYSAGVAYTAPVGAQAEALTKNHSNASNAKANASQIGNNIPQSTYEKLMQIGR